MFKDDERSAYETGAEFDYVRPPFPMAQFEIASILDTWYALANDHGVPQNRCEWTKKDSDGILTVYHYWKQLLVPADRRITLSDMNRLMTSYHFDLILELYLYRKCGPYFGTVPPKY